MQQIALEPEVHSKKVFAASALSVLVFALVFCCGKVITISVLESMVVIGPKSISLWALEKSESYGGEAASVLYQGFQRPETRDIAADIAIKSKLLIMVPTPEGFVIRVKTWEEAQSGNFPGEETDIDWKVVEVEPFPTSATSNALASTRP